MKKIIGIAVLLVLVFLIWSVFNSSKPELRAKVSIGSNSVAIINGNDQPWGKTTILLNREFLLEINEAWQPGERKEFELSQFKGAFNKQPYNPEYDKANKVYIESDGFQSGLYR